MPKRWLVRPHDATAVAALERSAGVPGVVASLLVGRGVTDPAAVKAFLAGTLTDLRDPETLPGVPEAADRILAAVRAGRRIVIYGDYDADGMTATAILIGCLEALDAAPRWYVPNRFEEGYGLNAEALEKLAADGANLVITVDCGIASVAEAARARALGLELIVTDHHSFAESLPEADVLVHPRLPGTAYPFGELCGAGVAFKLAWAIATRASGAKQVTPRLREMLLRGVGLAALGTVADVVPLVDENRIIVRRGLECLRQRGGPGLAKLLELASLHEKSALESEDVAFRLAPRLNAAGRFGEAAKGIELLTTADVARAESLASYVHDLNIRRESEERSIILAATKQALERSRGRRGPCPGRPWVERRDRGDRGRPAGGTISPPGHPDRPGRTRGACGLGERAERARLRRPRSAHGLPGAAPDLRRPRGGRRPADCRWSDRRISAGFRG